MRSSNEAQLKRVAGRIAGVTAVGALGALLGAPLASADTVHPPVASSAQAAQPKEASATAATSPATTSAKAAESSTAAAPLASTAAPAPLVPNYGFQKARVGIKLKAGAVVPQGTSLAGATIQVTTDAVTTPIPAPASTATCTTGADGFCDTSFGDSDPDGTLTLAPGQTLTAVQKTAPPALAVDSETLTLGPCEDVDGPLCSPQETDLVFADAGLPPVAKNDTAAVTDGKTVTIDVLANDSGDGAPITSITAGPAQHGTVTVTGTKLSYVAEDGFSGSDNFSYTITTANGSSTAQVDVTVTAAATTSAAPTVSASATATVVAPTLPVAVSSSSVPVVTVLPVATVAAPVQPQLANTGAGDTTRLTAGGVGLVSVGALVIVGATRRRTQAVAGRRH